MADDDETDLRETFGMEKACPSKFKAEGVVDEDLVEPTVVVESTSE